jgi:ABC transporter transmembrane region
MMESNSTTQSSLELALPMPALPEQQQQLLQQEGKAATNDTPMIPSKRRNERSQQPKEKQRTASLRETLAFVFDNEHVDDDGGKHTSRHHLHLIFAAGVVGALVNGLIYPAIAFLFAGSMSTLSGLSNHASSTTDSGSDSASSSSSSSLEPLAQMAFNFMIVGVVALIFGLLQGWCFEIVAHHGAKNYSRAWFEALLRQDAAFFGTFLDVIIFILLMLAV